MVRFHTALFASEPEIVNKAHVLRSSIKPNQSSELSRVSVRLFGPHQSAIAVFTPAQKIHTKGRNELELDSIQDKCEYTLRDKRYKLHMAHFPFFNRTSIAYKCTPSNVREDFPLTLFLYFGNKIFSMFNYSIFNTCEDWLVPTVYWISSFNMRVGTF